MVAWSAAEFIQVFTSSATLLAAIGTLIMSVRANHKIEQVHQATNGLTAKLVASTATASKAEGNLEGRAELKQEQKS